MRIIKKGKITIPTYRVTCPKCQTMFECTSGDANAPPLNGVFEVTCPYHRCCYLVSVFPIHKIDTVTVETSDSESSETEDSSTTLDSPDSAVTSESSTDLNYTESSADPDYSAPPPRVHKKVPRYAPYDPVRAR